MAVKWYEHLWPMGGVLSASLFIAWATEVAAFFLSRGFAFAILALLQVLPEFAVEAVITVNAGKDAAGLEFVTANFTGANRLIVGLFVPMTFFLAAWRARKRQQRISHIELPRESSIEVVFLLIATVYSLLIPLRGRLTPLDTVILVGIYLTYLFAVYRLPSEDHTQAELPLVPRTIRTWSVARQKLAILALFAVGGTLLFVSVEPFYHNTIELGAVLGLSAYFLFQWLAPFLSEFPEFVTIFYWGRTGRAQLGLTNAISSKINQWTLLIAMIPLAYAFGTSTVGAPQWEIAFSKVQRIEILLTAMQGFFAALILMNLRFERWEAHALLWLWALQVFDPLVDPWIHANLPQLAFSPFETQEYVREWFVFVYFALCILLIFRQRARFVAFEEFGKAWRTYVRPRPGPHR